jgi:hypothetical protein
LELKYLLRESLKSFEIGYSIYHSNGGIEIPDNQIFCLFDKITKNPNIKIGCHAENKIVEIEKLRTKDYSGLYLITDYNYKTHEDIS